MKRRTEIEHALTAALHPAAAPGELWRRVDQATRSRARQQGYSRWQPYLMAAALAALMSGGVIYLRAQTAAQTSLAAIAADLHRATRGVAPEPYAVERFAVDGNAVTLVSLPAASDAPARSGKRIRTVDVEPGLRASEWTHHGRTWMMITTRGAAHARACSVCHRA